MRKQAKAILSCRISPALKEEVENNAEFEGLTTSNYVEQLIRQQSEGEHISENKEQEYLQRIENLERKLSEAEEIQASYEVRIDETDDEIAILKEELKQSIEKSDRAMQYRNRAEELADLLQSQEETIEELKGREFLHLLPAEREDYQEYMDKLKSFYPQANKEQILIGSLYSALKNEKPVVFVVSQVRNYLNKL